MNARRPSRLPQWQEWSVYISCGLLIISGIGWLIFDQWVRVAGEFGSEHHPVQHLTLILHGIAAYAFLIVAGTMVPVHIRLGWTLRRNRKSGLTFAVICMVLALTALGLYYFGEEVSRHWTSLVHWVVGLAALPVLMLHAITGRRAGQT